ncbi:MAG: glycosyltransferase family 4 protein [Candidatus Eisenbacteria bacterium]|uniref:Glycosyltransferase family 4 protein n=1 Tax=Eiseniibacteriota bacterium TaxID=2212470 RepID=A0A948RWV5_UNCEI|nr:glycosyltransferase family 4 protein [Candidatus Eisenbacteria bacterium]MBU1951160.1 glycosyltransferase family 4 protein [Candidatus Eisenbacteria bacterium]MBU2692508.1 glycosyltransferase family 4 protein [Candidatus Eisenbacteria bacterium]
MRPRLLAVFPDRPWPPTAGNRVRNLSLLQALSGSFQLTIVYLAHGPEEADPPEELQKLGRVVPFLAPHKRSRFSWIRNHLRARLRNFEGLSRIAYFQSPPEFGKRVEAILKEESFDIVHVAYWYTLRHLFPFPRPPLWCLDTHDVFFEREALLYGRIPPRAKSEELRMLRAYDAVIAITPRDGLIFKPLLSEETQLIEVGMGVDAKRWSEADPAPDLPPDRDWIVFYGAMGTKPNLIAVKELTENIFPGILAQWPRAGLLLLGSSPHPDIIALGRRPEIHVPGTVPDPANYLRAGRVLTLPLRVCSGFRSRAVEALAAGIPIVAYPEAMDGLKVESGRHWVAAGNPQEMITAVVGLLKDQATAGKMAALAQKEVVEQYTWKLTYGRLATIYLDLLLEN